MVRDYNVILQQSQANQSTPGVVSTLISGAIKLLVLQTLGPMLIVIGIVTVGDLSSR
jgi:hypothetical protein